MCYKNNSTKNKTREKSENWINYWLLIIIQLLYKKNIDQLNSKNLFLISFIFVTCLKFMNVKNSIKFLTTVCDFAKNVLFDFELFFYTCFFFHFLKNSNLISKMSRFLRFFRFFVFFSIFFQLFFFEKRIFHIIFIFFKN